jgi:hypothetical protein
LTGRGKGGGERREV